MSGIGVGGMVIVLFCGGGMCLLVVILVKKKKRIQTDGTYMYVVHTHVCILYAFTECQ